MTAWSVDTREKSPSLDFAALVRRSRFQPVDAPAGLLAALEGECTLKEGAMTTRLDGSPSRQRRLFLKPSGQLHDLIEYATYFREHLVGQTAHGMG